MVTRSTFTDHLLNNIGNDPLTTSKLPYGRVSSTCLLEFLDLSCLFYCLRESLFLIGTVDLPQVDLMNFRVGYVRSQSGSFLGREAARKEVARGPVGTE